VLRLLGLALPTLLTLLLPVSLLLAVLVAMGRMSADSEVIAMRACGVGLARNVRPALALAALVFLAAAANSLWAEPLATRSFKKALYDSVKGRLSVMTQAGVFTELADGSRCTRKGWTRRPERCATSSSISSAGPPEGSGSSPDRGRSPKRPAACASISPAARCTSVSGRESLPAPEFRDLPAPGAALGVFHRLAEHRVGADPRGRPHGLRPEPKPRGAAGAQSALAVPASCLVFGLLGASLGVYHSRSGRAGGS